MSYKGIKIQLTGTSYVVWISNKRYEFATEEDAKEFIDERR